MIISKNSFGVSATMNHKIAKSSLIGTFGGSSSNRPKRKNRQIISDDGILNDDMDEDQKRILKIRKMRKLSPRSKSKIRNKIIALSRITPKLSFVTLTFVNKVRDDLAIKILRKFLDNAKKRSKDFQYIWVAEKQTNNKVFENNIHFHLITNKYWEREKWRKYWLDVQRTFGIIPRNENITFPTSALDVRGIKSKDIKGITNYLTKYVTKNSSEFNCQVWNCSKKISRLYTCFYDGLQFVKNLERLNEAGQLGGELKIIPKDYCNVVVFPLNRITIPLFNKVDDKNKIAWEQND